MPQLLGAPGCRCIANHQTPPPQRQWRLLQYVSPPRLFIYGQHNVALPVDQGHLVLPTPYHSGLADSQGWLAVERRDDDDHEIITVLIVSL